MGTPKYLATRVTSSVHASSLREEMAEVDDGVIAAALNCDLGEMLARGALWREQGAQPVADRRRHGPVGDDLGDSDSGGAGVRINPLERQKHMGCARIGVACAPEKKRATKL